MIIVDQAVNNSILIHTLKDIYGNPTIGPLLGLRGGTAAYLFYGLNRFSMDLEFDLLDVSKKSYVVEQLQKILEKRGAIKEFEMNCEEFGSRYKVASYLGIPMKVMVQEDLATHTMVAMLERIGDANRDIFDTYFFLKHNWPINEQIIATRTGLLMPQFLRKCIDALESMDNRGILSGLGDLLDAKQKSWVKDKLRDETIFLLKLRLEDY